MKPCKEIGHVRDGVNVISLGAGVQSSTMALMAAHGELVPMPVAAIFADTQDEPQSVYLWIDWLEKQLPFPVYRVTAGKLSVESFKDHERKSGDGTYVITQVPAFTNTDGKKGIIQRQCTNNFKIQPINKWISSNYPQGVTLWIGISCDEAHRMKPSRKKTIEHCWPLVELGHSRAWCYEWMATNGYPEPPRSACVFCPFRSNDSWDKLKKEEPEAFQEAVDFDRRLRESKGPNYSLYLHSSLKPLDQVSFSVEGQQLLWGNECEGMCGV